MRRRPRIAWNASSSSTFALICAARLHVAGMVAARATGGIAARRSRSQSGADFQSAVSQVFNLRALAQASGLGVSPLCRLNVCATMRTALALFMQPCAAPNPPRCVTRDVSHAMLTSARRRVTLRAEMNDTIKTLGLIAGSRSLPLELARHAKAQGVQRLVAVAFEGETDPALAALVDQIVWLRVGQLSKMIAAFTDHGVKQCVMAGQIAPKNLFDVRPDLRAMMMLLRLKEKNAQTVFGAIAEELRKDGVELIEATPWLKALMPGRGFRLGPKLSAAQEADVAFGFRIAKEVSRLEIGQTVVVKNGTVLAAEGFEGTDACLARGGELAGQSGGAVAIKVTKEQHDMRFDIPCVGSRTVEVCAQAGIAVLALEADRTLLLDRTEVEKLADRISIVACG